MSFKIILVHCDASETTSHRADMAVGLAERFGAQLVGLHVRRPFEPPVGFGAPNRLPMDELLRTYDAAVKADEAVASAAFTKSIEGRPVSTQWRAVDGHIETEIVAQARYADLAIVGQGEANVPGIPSSLPEAVALASGRPILVVPRRGAAKPPGKVVMLCWNASREAARAASDALPLLQGADKVVVLVIAASEPAPGRKQANADMAAWLKWHGVKFTIEHHSAPDADAGSVILSRAADCGVDLIVMGVYGHSRVRELVLGGASLTVLGAMTVPVFTAH